MEKFKIGDRVKHKYYGLGIVKETNPSAIFFDYSVLFDNGIECWCFSSNLTKIKPQKQTIVIKREDDTVTAYMGKHKAVAKCSPNDEFDLYKGAVLAITRLLVEGKING